MPLQIPIIDVSNGYIAPSTVAKLRDACENWGFFQITGHGIEPLLRDSLFAVMREFFALPVETKQSLLRGENNFWGYYDRELTKNRIDQKEIFDIDANIDNLLGHRVTGHTVPWPEQLPDLRRFVTKWLRQMENISQNLLGAICQSLGESSDTLNPFFLRDHSSFLRLNYYPPAPARQKNQKVPSNNGELGIHPHTDAGALTVLLQDSVAGLQVIKDGTWHTVEPVEDSLIINIGDMVQIWSNDRFQAPEHRVLASGSVPRYSAPYFFNPSYETVCSPLVKNKEMSRYRPVPWSEFREGRAAGDYANLGEEIQIARYRL